MGWVASLASWPGKKKKKQIIYFKNGPYKKKILQKNKQNCLTKMPTLSSFQLVLLPAKFYAKQTKKPKNTIPGVPWLFCG